MRSNSTTASIFIKCGNIRLSAKGEMLSIGRAKNAAVPLRKWCEEDTSQQNKISQGKDDLKWGSWVPRTSTKVKPVRFWSQIAAYEQCTKFCLHSKLLPCYGAPLCRDSRARHVGKAGRQFPQENLEWEFQCTIENGPVIYNFENPSRQNMLLFFWPKQLARNVGGLHTVSTRRRKFLIKLGHFV